MSVDGNRFDAVPGPGTASDWPPTPAAPLEGPRFSYERRTSTSNITRDRSRPSMAELAAKAKG
jgi:hypothetical protein